MRMIDQEDCIVALMGASKEVQEKFFSTIPERARNYIKERMEELVQKIDADAIQDVQGRIMYVADNLEAEEAEFEQMNATDQPKGKNDN